ncbi:hypothetical protein LJC26_06365 [Desulfovibrio sp. OttesenSCG-928-O18]|nr:hypothetical protein [Desulfovibrio sp. OttesenSCG-928-O18]
MRRSLSRFFMLLSVICVTALCVSPLHAAEAKDRYIKVVSVEGKVLTLNVDGRPVRIPLPEGYEVMREEEFAETYRRIVDREKRLENILLCILVDSNEAKARRSGTYSNKYKSITLSIVNIYVDERYSHIEFEKEKLEIKNMKNDAINWANSELKKMGRSPFTMKIFFENKNAVSFLELEDYASQGDFRMGVTTSYIFFDNVVIMSLLHKYIYEENDLDVILQDTITYAKQISR